MHSPRLLRVVLVLAAAACPALAAADMTAPKIIQTVDVRFPESVDTRKVTTGAAELLINVDADGRLGDWLVVSFTRPAFADEAVRALKQWRYRPARVDGQAVGCRFLLTFSFTAKGKLVLTEATGLLDNFITGIIGLPTTRLLCRPQDLDRPVAPLQTVAPLDPAAFTQSPAGGHVLVDFYIDQDGRPRLPVIVSSTEDLYAKAAVNALAQWRFQPPTRTGRPVAMRVQQEFVFQGRS